MCFAALFSNAVRANLNAQLSALSSCPIRTRMAAPKMIKDFALEGQMDAPVIRLVAHLVACIWFQAPKCRSLESRAVVSERLPSGSQRLASR